MENITSLCCAFTGGGTTDKTATEIKYKVNMSIDLYCTPWAPTTPIIVQLAESLGVKVNQIVTDVHKGEAKTPEFLKVSLFLMKEMQI